MHQIVPQLKDGPQRVLPIEARALALVGSDGRMLIDAIDLTIADAGILVVVGPNGAGKSLLLKTLAGLLLPSAGKVTWNGTTPDRKRMRRIGFVFPKPVLLRRSALANVTFALSSIGIARSEAEDRGIEILRNAGLSHLATAPARRLSSGEQQRLSIARALAMRPEVLFLDEPATHLDPASTASVERAVMMARQLGIPIVFVTHDLAQAKRLGGEVAFLNRGRLVERGDAKKFFANPQTAAARAYMAGDLAY